MGIYKLVREQDAITRNNGDSNILKNYLTKDFNKNFSLAVSKLAGIHDLTKSVASDRVYYIVEGSAIFNIGKETIEVSEKDTLFIEKNTEYSFQGNITAVLINMPAFGIENDKNNKSEKKIYIPHSKKIDYINELYKPIRESMRLKEYNIIFPHEYTDESNNPRDFYKGLDLVIAEVSESGTGIGIELGWVYDNNIPIYCIYKKGSKVSSSLRTITTNFIEYEDTKDLEEKIYEIAKG